jgi:hypothetical protein
MKRGMKLFLEGPFKFCDLTELLMYGLMYIKKGTLYTTGVVV